MGIILVIIHTRKGKTIFPALNSDEAFTPKKPMERIQIWNAVKCCSI
jgi:hypothetical protein